MPSDAEAPPIAYAGVVIDLDGVCYRGNDAIPGSADAIARLRSAGVGVAFATNNATRTQKQSADKLRSLGFDAEPDEIITSAIAAADLVEPGTRCLVIGMQGLRDALTDRGCELVEDAGSAQVVVTGLDHELTYDKLVVGTRALLAAPRVFSRPTLRRLSGAAGLPPRAGIIVHA